jgi:hypothetical protein
VVCILLLGGTVGAVIYYNSAYNNYASTHKYTDSDYKSIASQLADANATISSLNSTLNSKPSSGSSPTQSNLYAQITALTNQLAAAQKNLTDSVFYYEGIEYVENTQIADLNNAIISLESAANLANAISNFTVSEVWIKNQTVSQPAGSYTTWSPESAIYAGYVAITVSSSTTSSTYANVTYSANGVKGLNFNYNNQTNVGSSGTAYFPVLPSSNIAVGVGNGNSIGNATETVTITYYY